MKGTFPVEKFSQIETPFYYYDTDLLRKTLDIVKTETEKIWLCSSLCSKSKCEMIRF